MDHKSFNAQKVLAQNVRMLLKVKGGPRTQDKLARAAGIAQATVGRVLAADTAASIDTVEAIAGAYGLEAWQLLVAGMDPANPPVLQPVSAEERELYERLQSTVSRIAEITPPKYKVKPE